MIVIRISLFSLEVLNTTPIKNWKSLSNHAIWKKLKQHPYFLDLTVSADYLDSVIQENLKVFNWFGDRQLLISAHPTEPNDYDFLFILDLKNGAKHEVVLSGIEKVLKRSGYEVITQAYNGFNLVQATNSENDMLCMAQIGNQLICAFTVPLVEQSIDAYANPSLAVDTQFLETYELVSGDGLAKMYVQYDFMDEFMSVYFDEGEETFKNISHLLKFSSLDFETEESSWELNGYTNLDTTAESYFHAVVQSGTSKNTVGDVLSNRTAWFLSFNFESFSHFSDQLETVLEQNNQDLEQYKKSQKRIENLLNISVKRDLLDWIGDEVTVGQLRKNLVLNSDQNAVILLKARNIDLARERLLFIGEQVRKRTPAKFKQIDYRSYQIQYLDIKGFFRTFFGKAFDRIDKPYYTLLGEYVVFSNSPYTLIGLIEDFEYGRNLSNTSYYKNYVKDLAESSVTLYASPTNMYPVVLPLLDAEGRKEVAKSKSYFEAFDVFGLQLTSDGNMLQTHVVLSLSENQMGETTAENTLPQLYKRFASVKGNDPDEFVLQLIEDGTFKKYFPNSKTLQIKAETKKGVLHGTYIEYYENGKLRMEGKYKMGRKKGNWKVYDSSGEFSRKKY